MEVQCGHDGPLLLGRVSLNILFLSRHSAFSAHNFYRNYFLSIL
jgi:hypothetical protein